MQLLQLLACLLPVLSLVFAHPILDMFGENPATECKDKKTSCVATATCCLLGNSGEYGCCPHRNAICCSDKLHCCPSGYKCDISAKACTKGDTEIAMFEEVRHPEENSVRNYACEDKKTSCPDKDTCCKRLDGLYGCCPLNNAVCCKDKIHCCPVDTTCDKTDNKCTDSNLFTFESTKVELPFEVCPDGTSECPSGSTCCKIRTDKYGCCPLKSAVCCSDNVHCCPEGYTCDVSAGTCSKGNDVISFFKKSPALKSNSMDNKLEDTSPFSVKCPDDKGECADGTTCCETTTGNYGCCPEPNAVCCSDKIHCCPEGYTCNVGAGTCSQGNDVISFFKKSPTLKSNSMDNKLEDTSLFSVKCPDDKGECADGTTCCETTTGNYGCCPEPNAVCCSDKIHCCPEGYTCNVGAGTCSQGNDVISFFKKSPTLKSNSMDKKLEDTSPFSVTCPDDKSACPNDNTCCMTTTGNYGCCPQPNAVCCSDKIHCCPEGYICHVKDGKCLKGNEVMLYLEKTPALKVPNVQCPNSTSACPKDSTCCLLSDSTTYGCCPQVDGMCCSDHVHCCPKGYKCDLAKGICDKADAVSRALAKPLVVVRDPSNVVCPHQQVQCLSGNTCCKEADGEYGCCPLEDATCCPDQVHCCPKDFTCDSTLKTCVKSGALSLGVVRDPSNVVCPHQEAQCLNAFCPYQDPVNCPDQIHCCPKGFKCDLTSRFCYASGAISPMLALHSHVREPASPEVIVCKDGETQCPDKSTCCKVDDPKGYACCAIAEATCCGDDIHCCPHDYTCEPGSNKCTRGNLFLKKTLLNRGAKATANVPTILKPRVTVPLLQKLPADGSMKNTRQVCADGNTCTDSQTCCLLISGSYGCCPTKNAVCCSDHTHCCPSGMTCNPQSGTCTEGSGHIMAHLLPSPSVPVDKDLL